MPGRKDIAVKQSIPKHFRYTIDQFNAEFPTDDACLEYTKEQRWPNGITFCEKCQKETKHHRITGRTAYSCDHCGTHIYPLAETAFEKTSTSLRAVVLGNVPDGRDTLRDLRKAGSARNRRHLQNCVAQVSPDSVSVIRIGRQQVKVPAFAPVDRTGARWPIPVYRSTGWGLRLCGLAKKAAKR